MNINNNKLHSLHSCYENIMTSKLSTRIQETTCADAFRCHCCCSSFFSLSLFSCLFMLFSAPTTVPFHIVAFHLISMEIAVPNETESKNQSFKKRSLHSDVFVLQQQNINLTNRICFTLSVCRLKERPKVTNFFLRRNLWRCRLKQTFFANDFLSHIFDFECKTATNEF